MITNPYSLDVSSCSTVRPDTFHPCHSLPVTRPYQRRHAEGDFWDQPEPTAATLRFSGDRRDGRADEGVGLENRWTR